MSKKRNVEPTRTSSDMMTWNENALQEIMTELNLTRIRLMRCVNHTSYASIDNWIRGASSMTVNNLCQICSAYGADLLPRFFSVNGLPYDEYAGINHPAQSASEGAQPAPQTSSADDESKRMVITSQQKLIEQQGKVIEQQQIIIDHLQAQLDQFKANQRRSSIEPIKYGLVCDDSEPMGE